MSGTHYTLTRDLDRDRPKLKACRKCMAEKPNDFAHFGKKFNGTRDQFTTVDVCKDCTRKAISEGVRKNWRNR
jgi:hypothetical protein